MKQEILVVGITGMLGAKIATAILDRGEHTVRALVRTNRPELAPFRDRGVTIVEGDILHPNTLDKPLEGVAAVVSAVNNQPELIVDGQANLLRAAERHNIARFIPSDFSVDYRKLAMGDNDNLDMRKRFLPILEASKVPHTLVLNGAFLDVLAAPFFDLVSLTNKQVHIWGDGNQPMDFTDTTDVAKFVAATVLDPRTANRALRIAGDVQSSNQLAALLPGFTSKPMGSVDDLKARIAIKQKGATNSWAYLGDQYLWSMVSGLGKLDELDNALYPEIQTKGVLEFLGFPYRAAANA